MNLFRKKKSVYMVVAAVSAATFVMSCGHNLSQTDQNVDVNTPVQTVDSVYATKSRNGLMQFRVTTARMEKYQVSSKVSYDEFTGGFFVYGYEDHGLLETEIQSDKARHDVSDTGERWSVFGNVVITNYIKGQVIKTDTIYWDQKGKRIWTDCFVVLSSPQGLMQGYGMESDEMVRNAVLVRPFDSFGIVDSTKISYTDTANFIGPVR